MLRIRSATPVLACFGALAASLLFVASAAAEPSTSPATVTVRVEGLSETLLPPTVVTTNTESVVKDNNPADACLGTSAAGALELATKGNWDGTWYGAELGYSVETLMGVSYPFTQPYYWELWIDNAPASEGPCGTALANGESILYFPECFSVTPGVCPAPPNPLGLTVPGVAEVGVPVPVTVTSYANLTGTASPAAGATVESEGVASVAGADGKAALTFEHPGNVTVRASAPQSVRAEAVVCVQAGSDGPCSKAQPKTVKDGGSAGGSGGGSGSGLGGGASAQAFTASLLGLSEGRVYGPSQAPRLLQGSVTAGGITGAVKLRLTRRWRTRAGRVHCSFYSGTTDMFKGMRCGASHGHFFSVGSKPSFSYLLPAALPPGRYVLDLQATNGAGERTELARGSTRLVFYVR